MVSNLGMKKKPFLHLAGQSIFSYRFLYWKLSSSTVSHRRYCHLLLTPPIQTEPVQRDNKNEQILPSVFNAPEIAYSDILEEKQLGTSIAGKPIN